MVHSYYKRSDLATKLENLFYWLTKHYCELTGAIYTKEADIIACYTIFFIHFLQSIYVYLSCAAYAKPVFQNLETKLNNQNLFCFWSFRAFQTKDVKQKKTFRIFGLELILSVYRIILDGFWRKFLLFVGRKDAFCSSVSFHRKYSKIIRNAPKPLFVQEYEFICRLNISLSDPLILYLCFL